MPGSSSPLLELIREHGLLDDLQFEEVLSESKRSGQPAFQILQDQGILTADSILQCMASHLGTEVFPLRGTEVSKDVLALLPAAQARTLECLPVAAGPDGVVKVALVDPLNPARVDELSFVMKNDLQLVIADPAEVKKAIEKYYGEEVGGDFSSVLKELGADEEIKSEVKQVEIQDDD